MAEKEDSPEKISTIQDIPGESVSMEGQSSANSMVQALVADQSVLAAISSAILSAIKPVLPEHIVAPETSQKVAEPVGQSTNQNTGASVDQTVQGTKRNISDTFDLTDNEEHTSRKRLHLDLNGSENPDTFADADQCNYEHDGSLNTSSRWEASEELDALLGITWKPMPRFDRRTIIREFPRPSSDAAFTPMLDSYLPAMISGAKVTDNNLRDMQDKVLDVLGPLCTIYENLNVLHESQNENSVTLDNSFVASMLNCTKKAILLVGDTSAQLSSKRREQVLAKLNPCLSSLGKEEFPDAGKQLFGDGFESRLKLRSETANTVAQAKQAGRPFFRVSAPRRPQGRYRGGRSQFRQRTSTFSPTRGFRPPNPSFRSRGRTHTFTSPHQFHPRQ